MNIMDNLNFQIMEKAWNDMSIGNGQSWPLFEYSGSSEIVWGVL